MQVLFRSTVILGLHCNQRSILTSNTNRYHCCY